MNKSLLVTFFILACLIEVAAQPTATVTELQKHDLSWIMSAGDFDQSGWSIERIDLAITNRFQHAIATIHLMGTYKYRLIKRN